MSEFTDDLTLGRLAATHPAAEEVLRDHDLDYCCQGTRPFAAACREADIEPSAVLREIEARAVAAPRAVPPWLDAPLGVLVEHLAGEHRDLLEEALPHLEALARRVVVAHCWNPYLSPLLLDTLLDLHGALTRHARLEEERAFEALRQGRPLASWRLGEIRDGLRPVRGHLKALRAMTDGFVVPAQLCGSGRQLWAGLQELDSTLRDHVHVETNVLAARAFVH